MNIQSKPTISFSYSEKQHLKKIFEFVKGIVIKSNHDALVHDNVDTLRAGNKYSNAMLKKDTLLDYTIQNFDLIDLNFPDSKRNLFKKSTAEFFNSLTKSEYNILLQYKRDRVIAAYVETNPYYLSLNGEPANESEIIFVTDPVTLEKIPIHLISYSTYPDLYTYLIKDNKKIMREYLDKYDYDYINFLEQPIPYHISRTTRNFHIMQHIDGILSNDDVKLFYNLYYEVLHYISTVPYNKSNSSEELYDMWINMTILFMTILKLINYKFNKYITNDFSTKEEQRSFFKDYDMEYIVDLLPENYLKILIKNIDRLVAYKGSSQVIVEILKLFNITDIDVFKYALLKSYRFDENAKVHQIDESKLLKDNLELKLVQIPIRDVYESKSDNSYLSDKGRHVDFTNITLGDKFWGKNSQIKGINADEKKLEDIKRIEDKLKENIEFSYLYTKYIGTIAHIDIIKNLTNATYFLTSILNDENILDIKVSIPTITDKCSFRELFAAVNYLTLMRHGMDDVIIRNADHIASFLSFNTSPSLEELKNMHTNIVNSDGLVEVTLPEVLSEEEMFLVSKEYSTTGDDDSTIYSWYRNYEINMTKYNALCDKVTNETDINKYLAYETLFKYNMMSKSMLDMFDGFSRYEDFLKDHNTTLWEYIQEYLIVRGGTQLDYNGNVTQNYKNICLELISIFIDNIINNLCFDGEITESANLIYKNQESTFSKIFLIIELFKSYTVDTTLTNTNYIIKVEKFTTLKMLDTLIGDRFMSGEFRDVIENLFTHIVDSKGVSIHETIIPVRDLLKTQDTDTFILNLLLSSNFNITHFDTFRKSIDIEHSLGFNELIEENEVINIIEYFNDTLKIEEQEEQLTVTHLLEEVI